MNQCLAIVGLTKTGKSTKLASLEKEFKEKGFDTILIDGKSPNFKSDLLSLEERVLGRKELLKKHKSQAKTVADFQEKVGPIKNLAILIDELELSEDEETAEMTNKLQELVSSRKNLGLDFVFVNQKIQHLPAGIKSNLALTIECNPDFSNNIKLA